ncbi:MAG: hypothetical protein KDK04_20345, partial [Candidatus Competibacteraceae bacterium]|nr:hypothetical protein [Candidatus Competibacteraceae bacterium]
LLNAEAAHSSVPVSMAEFDPPAYPGQGQGQVLVQQARASTTLLRRRLAGLVQAQHAASVWCSRRGRRLQGRALYRLSLPDPVLFQRYAEQPVLETAVYILLDRSTSMRRRMALAAQAALGLALALEALPGVVVQVSAFPGSQDERLLPLVGFSEHSRRVAGRFQFAAQGNTPLPSALWRAGFELLQRPEPRRLLLTITDGEPQNTAAAQDVIARCRASRLEVLGVGIKAQQTVQTLFGPTYAVALDESAELAPALFQLLQRQLCQYVA